ncbi:oligosaccharide repeat unit polymerase [Eubacterium sp. MSJ-13]|uniref:O-antigen polymerase n=1 Tax=Eubacterium sp. MSJ-13 TaxID=2841513 RepID=UPI001C0FEB36|nr:O-antigen polymerase [Eubacterium sp. MSJ-13]MBU5477621.1 oligosaccharide repeat unit polymerase [Eubacterium sp. MSJ-13]
MAFIIFYLFLYLLLAVSWNLSKHDILSPNVLICASFIGGSTMYILGSSRLQVQDFTFTTTVYLIIGLVLFIVGCEFCKLIVKSTRKYSDSRQYMAFNDNDINPIKLPTYFYFVFALLVIFTAVLQTYYIKKMVGGSIISALSIYRSETLVEGNNGNTLVKLLSRIIYGIQPVLLFVICYNKCIAKKKFRYPLFICVAAILYMALLYLIDGSRGKIFSVFFQYLFAFTLSLNYGGSISKRYVSSSKRRGNRFWIKAVILIAAVGAPLFYYGGVIGGRNYSQISAFQSVENYFSYGLIRINLIISKVNNVASENWGQWSFSGIYSLLNKMHLVSGVSYDYFPFYKNYGNTITIFGRWYVDFGVCGIIVMAFITGIFYSYFYYRLKYTPSRKTAAYYSCLYVFLYSAVIMASYDDWFRSVITLNGIFQIVILRLIIKWIYKKYIRS